MSLRLLYGTYRSLYTPSNHHHSISIRTLRDASGKSAICNLAFHHLYSFFFEIRKTHHRFVYTCIMKNTARFTCCMGATEVGGRLSRVCPLQNNSCRHLSTELQLELRWYRGITNLCIIRNICCIISSLGSSLSIALENLPHLPRRPVKGKTNIWPPSAKLV